MAKKKSKNKSAMKANQKTVNDKPTTSPRTAKLVLLGFGIGPLILMAMFFRLPIQLKILSTFVIFFQTTLMQVC